MSERVSRGTGPAAEFTVGDWLVQRSLGRITHGEESVRLRPQLLNLLACLADRAGHTVSRDEILSIVWPGQYIAETGLARCIAELRQALGDEAGRDCRYIETIPKRGYRLVAPVGTEVQKSALEGHAAQGLAQQALRAPSEAAPGEVEGSALEGAATEAPPTGAARAPVVATATEDGPPARAATLTRRTLLAASIAAVALSAAFLAWRAIAPPVAEHDTLVIAFDNATGDPVFDGALRLALATQLEQSPHLRIVSERRVRNELPFMGLPPDAAITRAVALEACERIGAKAVVAGSLGQLGSHYFIGLEGTACGSGDVIAREQVEATGREQVLAALGQATSAIRGRLGESVASIRRYDVPIAQATTASLDALKAFSQGDFERARGSDEEAVRFYRRAIELDPAFALAQVRLGLQLLNLLRYSEGVAELKRAYEERQRASEAERFYITSCYHNYVLRDPIEAVEPLRNWRDSYPKSALAAATLASFEARIGRFDEALARAEEAVRLEPENALAKTVLIETLMRLGRFAEVRRLAGDEVARGRDSILLHGLLADTAFALDDSAAVQRELEWAASTPGTAALFLEIEQSMATFGGRMREASRLAARRADLASEQADDVLAALGGLDEAAALALAGRTAEPVSLVLAALARARTPETVVRAALVHGWLGDADKAEEYLREYDRMPDVVASSDPDLRAAVVALITMDRGFPQSAIEALAPLRPYEFGWRFNYLPAYVRGLALLRLGRAAEAAAEYERVVAHRGALPSSLLYSLSWLQLGRAREAAGDPAGSRAACDQFLQYWKDADADLPVLLQAREERLTGTDR